MTFYGVLEPCVFYVQGSSGRDFTLLAAQFSLEFHRVWGTQPLASWHWETWIQIPLFLPMAFKQISLRYILYEYDWIRAHFFFIMCIWWNIYTYIYILYNFDRCNETCDLNWYTIFQGHPSAFFDLCDNFAPELSHLASPASGLSGCICRLDISC